MLQGSGGPRVNRNHAGEDRKEGPDLPETAPRTRSQPTLEAANLTTKCLRDYTGSDRIARRANRTARAIADGVRFLLMEK